MSNSLQAVVSSSKSRIPPHQRKQGLTSRLPAALIRHILTFLPFREFMISQKTCKGFKWDILGWTKQRDIFQADSLFKFFQGKLGLPEEAAFAEMRKVRGLHVVDFCGLSSTRLTQLLDQPNAPILSNIQTLGLGDGLMIGDADEQLTKTLAQAPLSQLTTLLLHGDYSPKHTLQSNLLPVCPSLTNLQVMGPMCYEGESLSKFCPRLTRLTIQGYGFGISQLLQFTQLTSLQVDGVLDFENLKSLPHLSSLAVKECFEGNVVTDTALRHLAQIPRLRRLQLGLRKQPYRESMNNLNLRILDGSAQLRVLELHGLDRQRKPSLLNTLPPQITDLTLRYCGLVDRDFAGIGRSAHLRRLAIFTEGDQGEYTDPGIAQLRSCKALTALEFNHRPYMYGGRGAAFTTEGLGRLLQELPALQQLTLADCSLAALDTAAIERAFPRIDVIHPSYWLK